MIPLKVCSGPENSFNETNSSVSSLCTLLSLAGVGHILTDFRVTKPMSVPRPSQNSYLLVSHRHRPLLGDERSNLNCTGHSYPTLLSSSLALTPCVFPSLPLSLFGRSFVRRDVSSRGSSTPLCRTYLGPHCYGSSTRPVNVSPVHNNGSNVRVSPDEPCCYTR